MEIKMTKKELLEAIKDMPNEAVIIGELLNCPIYIEKAVYNEELNAIILL